MVTENFKKSIRPEHLNALLESISIFGGLSKAQTDKVLALMTDSQYGDKDKIFAKGDMPSHIYVVISGKVRLDFELSNHPLSEITFDSGCCFGETSLIGILPHSASVYSLGNTEVLCLSGYALLNLFEQDLELFSLLILNIAREACRRLHSTDKLFLQYGK